MRSLARPLAAFARCLLAPALIAGAVAGLGAMSAVRAQPVRFGSADDPREPGRRAPWQSARHVALRAGPSLVGPQWRAFLTGAAAYIGPSYATRLEGTLRGGVYGAYDEDADEAYDLVRLVDYARYARSGTGGGPALYTRAGPIQQMTLGPAGHLVHFFRSNTAYDERTVGAEAFAQTDRLSLGLFTDNVLVNGVTGGRLAARPFPGDGFAAPLASTEVGLTAVTDLGLRDDRYADSLETPTALALDASYDATSPGGIALRPFASAAAFADYGWGTGAGAALSGDNFARLARFTVRLGLFYSSSTPLSEIGASAGWRLGLRLLFFERFELRSSYYGHLGDQDLSRYHLRLFFQTRDGRARLFVRLDRGGLDHVFSVFGAADDQTAVTFNADYRLPFDLGGAGVWAHLRTRYTFERLDDGTGGVKRFLPQRRFEPSVGVRLGL
ncbi:MAG: hypothetical protein BRD37_07945 [Bacteroidetes bacterium QH_8_67_23]|nr:MAG: hypothetical protein BRD37_07945 [Bacteroidetes bacterium QH_8_67_23]